MKPNVAREIKKARKEFEAAISRFIKRREVERCLKKSQQGSY